jgi:hypothetical protein
MAKTETAQIRTAPCRLYFILARDADTGVIFRRGPSKWVQIIKWDTARDIFEPGQWFHGRIYEKRCDLSPDGSLMIYFANKIGSPDASEESRAYTYAWTAISRPPYLTALALWPKGDCWNGGGLFETDTRVWLNHPSMAAAPHPNHLPKCLDVVASIDRWGEDGTVLLDRLKRDGWTCRQAWKGSHKYGPGYFTEQPEVHVKASPNTSLTLKMSRSIVRYEDQIEFTVSDTRNVWATALEGAEWAEWDHRGRLVYAAGGKLFIGTVAFNGRLEPTELADFNPSKRILMPAPAHARRW